MFIQKKLPLFNLGPKGEINKSYRAILHDEIRHKQETNAYKLHHPVQKINQIKSILSEDSSYKILELFAGQGNLTKVYEQYGSVEAYDKKHLKTGDSYTLFHKLIHDKKHYDVVDVDPYGFPSRFFPDIFLLMEDSYLFLTFPKPYVNILNGITQTHLASYYGSSNPAFEEVIERIANFGICHWRKVVLIDSVDLKSVWRMVFKVIKVKATEYTGVKNR